MESYNDEIRQRRFFGPKRAKNLDYHWGTILADLNDFNLEFQEQIWAVLKKGYWFSCGIGVKLGEKLMESVTNNSNWYYSKMETDFLRKKYGKSVNKTTVFVWV